MNTALQTALIDFTKSLKADWDESLHPRDDHGKFTEGGGVLTGVGVRVHAVEGRAAEDARDEFQRQFPPGWGVELRKPTALAVPSNEKRLNALTMMNSAFASSGGPSDHQLVYATDALGKIVAALDYLDTGKSLLIGAMGSLNPLAGFRMFKDVLREAARLNYGLEWQSADMALRFWERTGLPHNKDAYYTVAADQVKQLAAGHKLKALADGWWPLDYYGAYTQQPRAVKGGPGSGNFGHAGRPGEVGGSAPSGEAGIGSESAQNRLRIGPKNGGWEITEAQELATEFKLREGFTYHPIAHSEPITGYMVSFPREMGMEREYTAAEYEARGVEINRAYLAELRAATAAGKFDPIKSHAGCWRDANRVVLDVSEAYDNRQEAENVGRQRKQDGIWDVAKHELIDLRGQQKSFHAREDHWSGNGRGIGRAGPEDVRRRDEALTPRSYQIAIKGGPGSGHFGHAGVIGHQGGSAPGDGASSGKTEPVTHTPEFKKWFGESKVVGADGQPLIVFHGSLQNDIEVFKTERRPSDPWTTVDRALGAHFAEDPDAVTAFTVGTYAFASDSAVSEREGETWYRDKNGLLRYDGIPVLVTEDSEGHKIVEPYDPKVHGGTWGISDRYPGASLRVVPPGSTGYPVYLSIKNPLVVTNDDREFDQTAIARTVAEKVWPENRQLFMNAMANTGRDPKMAGEVWDSLKKGKPYTGDYENYNSFSDVAHNLTPSMNGDVATEAKRELEKLGYDGVVYRNTSPNEVTKTDNPRTWIAFHSEQIKSAIGNRTFNPNDKRITKAFDWEPRRDYETVRVAEHHGWYEYHIATAGHSRLFIGPYHYSKGEYLHIFPDGSWEHDVRYGFQQPRGNGASSLDAYLTRLEIHKAICLKAGVWNVSLKDFDESLHPRDERGRFTDSGGGTEHDANFKKWFGNSKVVDKNGEPLMVYRGDRIGKTSFTGRENPSNYIQGNVFFSDNPSIGKFYTPGYRTNSYVTPDELDQSHGLYRAYLSLQKPLTIDARGESWIGIPIPRSLADTYDGTIQIDDLAVLAREKGYDGLIVKNVFDQAGEGNQYVAFRPDQIRLASGKKSLLALKDFDESLHPRDDRGRFADAGGSPLSERIQREKQVQFADPKTKERILNENFPWSSVALYHGTTDQAWEKISKEGLTVERMPLSDRTYDKYWYRWPEGRGSSVFLTPDKEIASFYADRVRELRGGKPLVLEVHIPPEGRGRLHRDEMDWSSVRFEGRIEPSWIKRIAMKAAGEVIYLVIVVDGEDALKGGAGSGNFGHAGILGHQGGSAPSGSQTDTPAFKKWFGNSKVVDSDGKPLVVYHGSTKEFSEFKLSRHSGMLGLGVYFTDDPNAAADWAAGPHGRILPVYLSIQNPFNYHDNIKLWAERYISTTESDQQLLRKLKDDGYDGIIDKSGAVTQYVVFDSRQIKSATGNRGTFDSTNPDITKALKGGAGSGHWGHAGVPEHRGGSAPGDGASTSSPAFKQWFGDSKVVDDNGDPLLVYHGTLSAFDQFDMTRAGENMGPFGGTGMAFVDDRNVAETYANPIYRQQALDNQTAAMMTLAVRRPDYENAIELANLTEVKTEHDEDGWYFTQTTYDKYGADSNYYSTDRYDTEQEARDAGEEDKAKDVATAEQRLAEYETKEQAERAALGRDAHVVDAYLRIEKPKTIDYEGGTVDIASIAAITRDAKAAGYDGVIFQNASDTLSGERRTSNIYIPFSAGQVRIINSKKSLAEALKTFDESLHPRDDHGKFTDAGGSAGRLDQSVLYARHPHDVGRTWVPSTSSNGSAKYRLTDSVSTAVRDSEAARVFAEVKQMEGGHIEDEEHYNAMLFISRALAQDQKLTGEERDNWRFVYAVDDQQRIVGSGTMKIEGDKGEIRSVGSTARGAGGRILTELIDGGVRRGLSEIQLTPSIFAKPFYARFGFKPTADPLVWSLDLKKSLAKALIEFELRHK